MSPDTMPTEYHFYIYSSCHFSERLDSDEPVGTGGYGVVITANGKQFDKFAGGFSYTTNARTDILAITEGLKKIKEPASVTVYLSNGYIIDALTKGWLEKWKREGFKKKKHVDRWKELDKVLQESKLAISYKHSKEVKYSKEFQLAEQLGKEMSGKRNLPIDLNPNQAWNDLLGIPTAPQPVRAEREELVDDTPILESICVDASTIENPGPTEYRGVDTKTGEAIFQYKYEEATNNIGEFLAIVHALALYKKQGKQLKVIYSDSTNAIAWVKQKNCKTKYEKGEHNSKLFSDIDRAVAWLENNSYDTKILKWNTGAWGQIPADYGKK